MANDIDKLIKFYNLDINKSGIFWFNFPHQTKINPNSEITKELAKKYCILIGRFLELNFLYNTINDSVLSIIFNKYIRKKNIKGVRCFSENKISLAINGDFLLCPYDDECIVGNIYTGIDWDKVESYIPPHCKECEIWQSCMNSCIMNITDNECYISKVIYKHFYKLMYKYGFNYEYLEKHIKE